MKNYKTKLLALMVAVLASATACEDILDTEPQGQETGQNYLNDPINAEQAVNAVYDVLHWDEGGKNSGHTYEWMFGDVLSDDAEKGSWSAFAGYIAAILIWIVLFSALKV